MAKNFCEVAFGMLATFIKSLDEQRGKMNLLDQREALKGRLLGAFDLIIAQLHEWKPSAEEIERTLGNLRQLAPGIERHLGAQEHQTLENCAALIRKQRVIEPAATPSS